MGGNQQVGICTACLTQVPARLPVLVGSAVVGGLWIGQPQGLNQTWDFDVISLTDCWLMYCEFWCGLKF